MKIAVIYHRADFDGILSREVCLHKLGQIYPEAVVHPYGWDYNEPLPVLLQEPEPTKDWNEYDLVFIVDLSVDELMARPELREKIVWIDHHKSAIEKYDKINFIGHRIDGVAACRLCWDYFRFVEDSAPLFDKAAFVDRVVREPMLLTLAGEYDVWDLHDNRVKPLQFGLRAMKEDDFRELIDQQFDTGLRKSNLDFLEIVLGWGYMINLYCDKNNSEYAKDCAQTIQWEGLTLCALNIGQRGNSDLLLGGIKPEHQACFAWRWTGSKVLVSLYHIEGHTDLDLSKIAVKHGGGGHRGACGFSIDLIKLDEIIGKQ